MQAFQRNCNVTVQLAGSGPNWLMEDIKSALWNKTFNFWIKKQTSFWLPVKQTQRKCQPVSCVDFGPEFSLSHLFLLFNRRYEALKIGPACIKAAGMISEKRGWECSIHYCSCTNFFHKNPPWASSCKALRAQLVLCSQNFAQMKQQGEKESIRLPYTTVDLLSAHLELWGTLFMPAVPLSCVGSGLHSVCWRVWALLGHQSPFFVPPWNAESLLPALPS